MPRSSDYQAMYTLLGEKFNPLPPLESLQTAILIDILAALERVEPKANAITRKPRKPKSG